MYNCNTYNTLETHHDDNNIRIYSRQAAYTEALANRLRDCGTILITDVRERLHFDTITNGSLEHLHLEFDDISYERPNYKLVTEEQIIEALTFAEKHKIISCVCMAGISRSSALAYCITVKKCGFIEADSLLNPRLHWPNFKIIELGQKILNEPNMIKSINNFYSLSRRIKRYVR